MEYIRTNIIGILVVVVGLLVVTNAYTLWRVNTGFDSAKEWHEFQQTYFAKADHDHEEYTTHTEIGYVYQDLTIEIIEIEDTIREIQHSLGRMNAPSLDRFNQ